MATIRRILPIIIITLLVNSLYAQELAQWRGDLRDGKYNDTGLLEKWPETGPEILWTATGLGDGYASVVVADNVYTTGATDSLGYVYAFDLKGVQLWKTYFGTEWTQSFPGTRTTPTYYMGKLYIHSSMGLGACLDAKTGEIIWSEDFGKKYEARIPRWGISEAPLIYKNLAIFTPGGEEVVMLAKDINTGTTVWESKLNGEKSAYCSPILINHNETEMILTHLDASVVAVNPVNGELIWSFEQTNKYSVHPNTPVYSEGMIYSVTGYKEGGLMLKMSEDGKTVSEVWRNETLDNQMGGAVVVNGNIYASGHNSDRSWQCLDWNTGEVKFSSKEISKGTIIYADDKLFCYGDKGEIGILKPTKEGFEYVCSVKVEAGTEQHWAHPVIKDGVLYIRHGDAIIAYKIK